MMFRLMPLVLTGLVLSYAVSLDVAPRTAVSPGTVSPGTEYPGTVSPGTESPGTESLNPVSPTLQNQHSAFMKRFDSAFQTGDEKGMLRVVKKYPLEAIARFETLANNYNEGGDTRLAPRMDKLKEVFNKAYGSTILEKIEDYTSEWGEEERHLRKLCQGKYRQHFAALKAWKKSKAEEDKKNAYSTIQEALDGYKDLGDMYRYTDCLAAKFTLLETVEKESVERMENQLALIDELLRVRKEELDFTRDKDYGIWSNWIKSFRHSLDKARKGGGLPGENNKKAKKAKKAAAAKQPTGQPPRYLPGSKWTRVEMLPSLLKEPIDSICAYGSSNPLDWNPMGVKGVGAVKMENFKAGDLYIQRTGSNKYVSLADAQGKKLKPIRLAVGNKAKSTWVSYFKSGNEDEIFEYSFFFWVGSQGESLFGIPINLMPGWGNEKYALLFYRSAAILHANVEGMKLKLYDDNFNGVVGEDPAKIAFGDKRFGSGIEGKQGMSHPAFDSMQVGKKKSLQPFSRYLRVGDYWYKLNVLGSNEQLNYRPMDPTTMPSGFVKMDFKGKGKAKPDYLIIQGQGFLAGAYFDIAHAGSKGIEVPAGKYMLYYGRVLNGKGAKAMNATMLRGDSKPFDVLPDQLCKVKVGAPYTIQFDVEQEGGRVIVDSSKFWVKDSAGMRYGRIGAEVLEPDLIWSKKNTGVKGKVLGSWRRMKSREDLDAIRNKYEPFILDAPYWCVTELEKQKTVDVKLSVKKPVKSGPFFVGVRQNKHKLFGKLLPVWK